MKELTDILEEAIESTTKLRKTLLSKDNRQVRSNDERSHIKATCLAWFRSQRPAFNNLGENAQLSDIDTIFTEILEYSDLNSSRAKYLESLKELKSNLVKLRTTVVTNNAGIANTNTKYENIELSNLVTDEKMLQILYRRWEETKLCTDAHAYLAATVMLGALLEALLLARFNREDDKSKIFKSKSVPKDKDGKSLKQKEWTLKHYIDVAHDLGWIRQSGRDVGIVMRDYRNYIHPSKELSHGITLGENDVKLFVVIFTSLVDQINESIKSI